MAQLVIAAAGAAIGSAIAPGVVALGMTGGGIGWMVGSLIGSTFAPTQKAEGPRLGDLTVGGSSYGAVIPYIEGHPRIAGQVIYASTKREIATTRRESGKGGGGGSQVTTYTYEVDVLILLTDCEIDGVRRVFSGGDLVYTAAEDATHSSLVSSYNTPQWTRMTVYGGGSSQLPDPDYEAAVGTANAPAYRGRGTVFIKSLQLGQSGQLPNLTFEVVRNGVTGVADAFSVEEVSGIATNFATYAFMGTASSKFGTAAVVPPNVQTLSNNSGAAAITDAVWEALPDPVCYEAWVYLTAYPSDYATLFGVGFGTSPNQFSPSDYDPAAHHGVGITPAGYIYPVLYSHVYSGSVGISGDHWRSIFNNVPPPTLNPYKVPLNTWVHIVLQRDGAGEWDTWCDGHGHRHSWLIDDFASVPSMGYGSIYRRIHPAVAAYYENTAQESKTTSTPGVGVFRPGVGTRYAGLGFPFIGNAVTGVTYTIKVDSFRISRQAIYAVGSVSSDGGEIIEHGYTVPTGDFRVGEDTVALYLFDTYSTLAYDDPDISTVVSRLCTDRAGLQASQFSVTGLSGITTPVHGMAISQVSSVRSVLEMLMGCYFFDCVTSDKLYFRARAGAVVDTITNDELGWSVDGVDFPDPLPLTMANELELPAQMALTYNNIDGDYQTDTQYSDRLISGQENTTVVQVPLGFTAAEAKVIAAARLADAYVARLSSQIALSLEHSELEPSDTILVYGADGSQFRQRLVKRTDSECVLVFDTVADDSTVFTQLGLTVGGTESQTVVLGLPDTFVELLDIPMLRNADNSLGIYVAVSGEENWTAGDLYHSTDGVTYSVDASFTQSTVIGATEDALDTWTGGTVFDEMSSVTVDVGAGELESVTQAEILNSVEANAAVIGSELVQFREATLLSPGVYKLTGFLRGRRGTEWAMSGHAAGERFVLLATNGMRFLALDTSDFGRMRYYKGVSAGQRLSVAGVDSITPSGINLKPLSPVNVRVDRTGLNPVVTWSRRTRFSTRVGGPSESIPLGEATEAYEVDVFSDNSFTTVIDTIETTSASATITAGSPLHETLYLRIYQMSEAVGRGYAAQVTLP